ncbi:hypothetical protein [Quadrisphaera granulorum]|nr:hypothetical protein [Quadrisphaera granulorum]
MQVVMVGYNFKWRDYAIRSTWQYLADAPADEVRAQINGAYEADNRQRFQALMTCLFDPAQRLNENGVPIYGLFSGDGFVPPTFRGTSFSGSHNHYMTTGSVTLDSGDVDALVETVVEHGYGGDGGKVLIFVNPRERKVISKFRVDSAASFDFIPSVSAPAYLTSKQVIGSAAPANYGRVPIVGSYGDALVSESTLIPQGYVLVVATDGPNSRRNVVGFREHPTPSNRGLIAVPGPVTAYPLQESFFVRGFGTGVRHRGAAAVMQITTGTYAPPAQYRRAA